MTDNRIIDISESGARLTLKHRQLVISRDDQPDATIPLDELAAIAVSNPQISLTQPVLAAISSAGAALIVCDGKHMPIGMMLPIVAHYVQSERFSQQADSSLPTRKRLWQQVVKAKIRAQGRLLAELHGDDNGLYILAGQVKSGDAENLEGQASRIYWPVLFSDTSFRRDRDAPDQNRHLNYGYAILRAVVSRAICASGLHPSLGLHHHNRYDPFCLASDLMEPFRPVVDRAVVRLIDDCDPTSEFDRETRTELLGALTGRFDLKGESRTLFDILARLASSLAGVFAGERKKLILPEI